MFTEKIKPFDYLDNSLKNRIHKLEKKLMDIKWTIEKEFDIDKFNIIKEISSELYKLRQEHEFNIMFEKTIKNKEELILLRKILNLEDIYKWKEKKRSIPIKEKKIFREKYINRLLAEDKISRTALLIEMEKIPDFNYLDFLRNYWLTEIIEKLWIDLVNKKLKIEINENNKEIILNNLKVFTSFIVHIESDGKNINNKEWSSWKWYFQYLFKNSKIGYEILIEWKNYEISKYEWDEAKKSNNYPLDWVKHNIQKFTEREKRSSFGNAVHRTKEYFWEEKYWPLWIKQIFPGTWPRDLSAEKQTFVFLVDIFSKNWSSKNLLKKILSGWDVESMRWLYEKHHHGNSKKWSPTYIRVTKVLWEYENLLTKD